LFFSATAQKTDSYARLVAFPTDRRLLGPRGAQYYTAGTYATTSRDANCVNNGAAAVGRYALLYLAPAIYKRDFSLATPTLVKYGTSLPAFGQSGGGSEVCFQVDAYIARSTTAMLPVC
jgi:hypothetical protein